MLDLFVGWVEARNPTYIAILNRLIRRLG